MSNVPPPPPPAGPPPGAPMPAGAGQQTNQMAIWSLVASCVGLLCTVGSIVGIVLGFMAKKQIQESGGTQGGDGLATAGIIIGIATLVLSLVVWATVYS